MPVLLIVALIAGLSSPGAQAGHTFIGRIDQKPCSDWLYGTPPAACSACPDPEDDAALMAAMEKGTDMAFCADRCAGSVTDISCRTAKYLDDGATANFIMTIAYTATAVFCAVGVAYPALCTPCQVLAMSLGLIDTGIGIGMQAAGGELASNAAQGRDNTANDVQQFAGLGTSAVSTVGSLAAGSGGGSGGSGGGQSNASCWTGFIQSTLMAVLKGVNTGIMVDQGEKLITQAVEAEGLPSTPDVGGATGQLVATPETEATVAGIDGPTMPRVPNVDSTSALRERPFTVGDIIRSAATGKGMTPQVQQTANALTAAASEIQNRTGLSIDDIGQALLNGKTPGEIVAAAVPQQAGAAAKIEANREKMWKEMGIDRKKHLQQQVAYATVGKGGRGKARKGGLDPMAMLQGLLNPGGKGKNAAARGVSSVRFGAPERATKPGESPIHEDTSRSLFDRVSSRWATLTARFIDEDRRAGITPLASSGSRALMEAPTSSGARAPAGRPAAH